MKLVTAIMPVRGRTEWAQRAVECFLAQDYPNKELLILQDEDDLTFDGPQPYGVEVSIFGMSKRLSIPAKRNWLCAQASMQPSDIICHWDSDDYSAPTRISDQVKRLEDTKASLTGYTSMLWWHADKDKAYFRKGDGKYILGTSFCFLRSQWEKTPFTDAATGVTWGEDNRFRTAVAKSGGKVVPAPGLGMMVARAHSGNTYEKDVRATNYKPIEVSELPAGFPMEALCRS